MEFSLIADTVTVCTAKQGIAFGKSLLQRLDLANHISFADSVVDHQSPGGGIVQASAIIFPVDAIAPPPVRSSSYKTIRRIRKKRRTRRVSFGGDGDDAGDFGRFLLEGDFGGSDGPFGFGGGGNDGGGKGWNYGGGGGGFGRDNWDGSSFSSWSDPAMEFVYEVICWIALSNCVHFAFKRIVRIVQVLNHHQQQRSRVLLSPPSRNYNIEARRNSMFAESNGFWDTKTYLQDIRSRRSLSRDMNRCNNEFYSEETELILQKKLEIAIKREKAQALALSNQIRSRSSRNQSAGDDRELLERTQWLDRWMATKQWDDTITNSTNVRDPIKTLEAVTTHHHQRSYPATPPSCRASRSVMVRSASPRIPCSPSSMQPNYMSATESAKAKARTQSTPRRRPMTAKKRLCYAEEESLRSPSFKSCLWGDHESDYSCCYGDGFAGKISPCSTTELRWLK